jgi:hypothetical protein
VQDAETKIATSVRLATFPIHGTGRLSLDSLPSPG